MKFDFPSHDSKKPYKTYAWLPTVAWRMVDGTSEVGFVWLEWVWVSTWKYIGGKRYWTIETDLSKAND